jgi:NADH-quinone oxidoreductase subunit L
MTSVLVLGAIGLPWLGALSVWLVGDARPRWQNFLAVGFSVAAGIAALALLLWSADAIVLTIPLGGVFGDFTFTPDGLGVFLAVVATVIGSLAVIYSVDYMRGEAQLGRYYALILLFIGAMAGLVLTSSLLLLFLFWELVAFCSYALISFHNDDPKAVAGGIKALIMTQIGGAGLLAGILLAYAYLGSYAFDALLTRAYTLPPIVLAIMAFGFLIAAAAKSAQVPFHTWLPDAMEAPTPVSALIHAATMVNAGVYVLARFYLAFAMVPNWATTVMLVGVASALLGAVMAVVTNDFKRVLAYSTISQLGYMVTAVGVGAIFASQFHLLSHAVFKALLFLGAGAVILATGTRDMNQMGGLSKMMPFVRNVFLLGAMALVGLPILNGFWSKELVLEACATCGQDWVYLGLLATVGITALYTFRMVWLVFFGKPRAARAGRDAPPVMRVALGALAIGTLTTWLLAGPFACLLGGSALSAQTAFLETAQVCRQVTGASSTGLALGVTALGFAAWWGRERLSGLTARLQWLERVTAQDFGFEWLNARIVSGTRRAAHALRATQTGELNWNMVGIVGGLVLVLAFVVWMR